MGDLTLLLWVLELVAFTERTSATNERVGELVALTERTSATDERVGDKVPVTEVEKVVVGEFVKEPDGEEDLVFPP